MIPLTEDKFLQYQLNNISFEDLCLMCNTTEFKFMQVITWC